MLVSWYPLKRLPESDIKTGISFAFTDTVVNTEVKLLPPVELYAEPGAGIGTKFGRFSGLSEHRTGSAKDHSFEAPGDWKPEFSLGNEQVPVSIFSIRIAP